MVATVLMDLSKAYDCIPDHLFIAKSSAYGIDSVGLLLISDYPSHSKQRTKIGCSSYSSWHDIIGVPQGSLLRPLLMVYGSWKERRKIFQYPIKNVKTKNSRGFTANKN